jgi:hypothetical protein
VLPIQVIDRVHAAERGVANDKLRGLEHIVVQHARRERREQRELESPAAVVSIAAAAEEPLTYSRTVRRSTGETFDARSARDLEDARSAARPEEEQKPRSREARLDLRA